MSSDQDNQGAGEPSQPQGYGEGCYGEPSSAVKGGSTLSADDSTDASRSGQQPSYGGPAQYGHEPGRGYGEQAQQVRTLHT